MRRKLTIIAAFLMVALYGSAQSTNFGISMGANFSNLVGRDKIENSSPRIGMCPGVYLDIPLAYESFLEIGAVYSQQGVTIKTENEGKNKCIIKSKMTRFVDYVSVPVLWKETFGDLYVKAGPYASLALQASSKIVVDTLYSVIENRPTGHYDSSADTTKLGESFNQSFVNSLRQYDAGLSFNIGFQTAIGNGLDIFFDASYKIGFFSVEEKPKTVNNPLRNQYFSVSAGLFFVKNRRSKTYRRR